MRATLHPALSPRSSKRPRSHRSLRAGAFFVVLAVVPMSLESGQQQMPNDIQPRPSADPSTGRNMAPDANAQMRMTDQQVKKDKIESANLERRKQIADDAARLLQLATELKAEVDKTGKDTLSLAVIRKAETIEKLAKGVKEKMKLTMGAS